MIHQMTISMASENRENESSAYETLHTTFSKQ